MDHSSFDQSGLFDYRELEIPYLSELRAISEEDRAVMERAVFYDLMTGVYSRPFFIAVLKKKLDQAVKARSALAITVLDLNGFKEVNDSQGHPAGNMVLKIVANRIAAAIPPEAFLARIGGDEFAILIEEKNRDKAVSSVEQLTEVVAKCLEPPIDVKNSLLKTEVKIFVRASMGTTIFPQDGIEWEELLNNADQAMYDAKREKLSSTHRFFDPGMPARSNRQFILWNSLVGGSITNEEFELFCQPIRNLKTLETTGFEILSRWNHPELGLVQPDEFLPIMVAHGATLPFTEWVLKSTAKELERRRPKIRMAINIGSEALKSGWAKKVKKMLSQTGLDPALFEFEISETSSLEDVPLEAINSLKETGVTVTLDDFGTKNANLVCLPKLPRYKIDKLKIDKQMLFNVPQDVNNAHIVLGVIAMAHSYGIKVIAEGIETKSQLEFLAKNGCDEGQGFFLGAPVPMKIEQPRIHAPRKKKSPAKTSKRKILIAEDKEDAALCLQMLLELQGHEALIAKDGTVALKIALREKPEVALIDIFMPGLNGVELAHRIRGDASISQMMLVATTAFSREDLPHLDKELEVFDHFLTKPFSDQELAPILALS